MAGIRVAVLGAGNIGGTLGRKWVAAGHDVTFGVRDPHDARAQALRTEAGERAKIGSVDEALAAGDVVVMALPGPAMDETIARYAAQLDGKTVVDAANRMGDAKRNSLATFQAHTPNARVYRAFNSYGWENFAEPNFGGVAADLFYAGPDGDSQATVEQLIADVGLRPVRLGDVDQTATVDAVASLWFALALGQRKGRHLAFKVLGD